MKSLWSVIVGAWTLFRQGPELLTTVKSVETKLASLAPEQELDEELINALAQLRTEQSSVKGRTGYGVTIFIPNETLEKLRPDVVKQRLFINKVAGQLVRRALYAVWSSAAGKVEFK